MGKIVQIRYSKTVSIRIAPCYGDCFMISKFFMPFVQNIHHNDSEGVRLWTKILNTLQNVMERMTPSLSSMDYNYAQWKNAAKKGRYSFFVSWLEQEGEQYLLKICSANLDDTISDRLLDQFDEAIFKLQMTSTVDDAEVLAADVADVLIDLADAIERYGKNII